MSTSAERTGMVLGAATVEVEAVHEAVAAEAWAVGEGEWEGRGGAFFGR